MIIEEFNAWLYRRSCLVLKLLVVFGKLYLFSMYLRSLVDFLIRLDLHLFWWCMFRLSLGGLGFIVKDLDDDESIDEYLDDSTEYKLDWLVLHLMWDTLTMKKANFMMSPMLFSATSRWLSPFTFFCLQFYNTCGSISRLWIAYGLLMRSKKGSR